MINITADSVRQGLKALVEQEGEGFIYKKNSGSCTYTRKGKGDCLVGRFLVAQGVPVERLEIADRNRLGLRASALFLQLVDEEVLTITGAASAMLAVAQDHQDDGFTWGESLSAALFTIDG